MSRMPAGVSTASRSGIITLTTDFGLRDSYLGAVKGVILAIYPGARLVDIAHQIEPQAVLEAAFILKNSAWYFPHGTVHLAVVDPGVGSGRRLIIVEAKGHLFVGPDNGLFSLVADGRSRVVRIDHPISLGHPPSATFHGRDILAPIAARLARGKSAGDFGRKVKLFKRLSLPQPREIFGVIHGEIIYVDRFGNLVTNVPRELLSKGKREPYITIAGSGVSMRGLKDSYYQGRRNELIALLGSHNFLELAVKDGSAHKLLGVGRGGKLLIRF